MKKAAATISTLMAVVMAMVLVLPQTILASDQTTEDILAQTDWVSEIDAMIAKGSYEEGQVLAVVNNNAGIMSLTETLGDEQEELMELCGETVEENLDVELESSDDAASIKLITSETQTTEELLKELSNDPTVIYASPNYISTASYEDDSLDEELTAVYSELAAAYDNDGSDEGEGEDPVDGSDPAEESTEDESQEESEQLIKTVSAENLSQETHDLITEQGYDTIGDMSYLQWGYTSKTTQLTISSPNWNEAYMTNASSGEEGKEICVAVLDSGVDYTHPDLQGVMMTNMDTFNPAGGKYGYNAVSGMDPTDPMDDMGHGTHCAGIIAASWDGSGSSGVCSGAKIVAVKAGASNGMFSNVAILRGYQYLIDCVDNGLYLTAVNCSFGGDAVGILQYLAATELGKRGVVSCFAAGNSTYDNDEISNSSSLMSDCPYVIGVGSAAATYVKSDFSNYGETTVNLFAPGDAILSTVSKESSSYFPSVDKNAVTCINFDGDESGVKVWSLENPTLDEQAFLDLVNGEGDALNITESGESYDKDGHSLELTLNNSLYNYFLIAVPAAEDQLDQVAHAAVSLKSTQTRCITWLKPVYYDGYNKKVTFDTSSSGWFRPSQVWCNHSVNMAESFSDYVYENGCLYFIISVYDSMYDASSTSENKLYVDDIGLGNNLLRYSFFQGTSMATPAVTGSVACVYSDLMQYGGLDKLEPAERAARVVEEMKGSTTYSAAFDGYCTSCGYFNFGESSLCGVASRTGTIDSTGYYSTPVINSVTDNHDGTIDIEGCKWNGSMVQQPAVYIDGYNCAVFSWSANKIKVQIPEGIVSGRHKLMVVSLAGKYSVRKIDLAETDGDYFDTIVLPEELSQNEVKITAIGSKVYATSEMLSGDLEIPTRSDELWCYDRETSSWSRLADIPVNWTETDTDNTTIVTLSSYQGLLYAQVVYELNMENNTKEEYWFYIPDTDKWIQGIPDSDDLPVKSATCGFDHGIILYGGLRFAESEIEEGTITSIKSHDIYILSCDKQSILNSADGTVTLTVKNAGTNDVEADINSNLSSVGDTIFFNNLTAYEYMTWSEETQTLEQSGIKSFGTLSYGKFYQFAEYTAVLTPEGVFITGINGENFRSRGYDTLIMDEDGTFKPYYKMCSYSDIYVSHSCYADGYVYVTGVSYYDSDTAALMYCTKISEDPEPEPEVGETLKYDETDGLWHYYKEGVEVKDKYGYVDYEGGKFLVANGVVATQINGLAQDPEHGADWYYLANGQAQTQYTGLAYYDGEWFYIENGKFVITYNGFLDYDGGRFVVAAGRIQKSLNGLWQYSDEIGGDNTWYFIANGQAQLQYTGTTYYDGQWFTLENGKLVTNGGTK